MTSQMTETVSKKKYDHVIYLKNRNWNDLNEYKNKCIILEEKVKQLEYRIKQMKEKHNITDEDESKNEVMELEFSSDEDDETDTYEVMERVDKQTELKQQLIKEEEENKLSERDILHKNLDEQKRLLRIYEKESNHKKIIKINKRIKIIETELQKELF